MELLDGEPQSAAADVYAAACVHYELCSGHHPFSRLTARQAIRMGQGKTLEPPPRLPRHCWPTLRRALAFEQTQRLDIPTLLAGASQAAPSLLRRALRRPCACAVRTALGAGRRAA